jgi:hypothetical protein
MLPGNDNPVLSRGSRLGLLSRARSDTPFLKGGINLGKCKGVLLSRGSRLLGLLSRERSTGNIVSAAKQLLVVEGFIMIYGSIAISIKIIFGRLKHD